MSTSSPYRSARKAVSTRRASTDIYHQVTRYLVVTLAQDGRRIPLQGGHIGLQFQMIYCFSLLYEFLYLNIVELHWNA